MDKKILIESAKRLKNVSEMASGEYLNKSEILVAKMNAVMLSRKDIDSLIGEDNISMMKDNHANHVRFIASVFLHRNDTILIETVIWVFTAYRSHGFTTNYWAAQLNTWITIIKEELSAESFREIYPYYDWMLVNIPVFVALSGDKLENNKSLY